MSRLKTANRGARQPSKLPNRLRRGLGQAESSTMATHTSAWPQGSPCWLDLAVPDLDVARAFYSAVLGWHTSEPQPDYGNYVMGEVDGVPAAGLFPAPEGVPTVWTVYFATDDAAATVERIAENGGTILMPITEVGPQGVMAVAMDPTGAVFGLWQGANMTGFAVHNQPGAFTWLDLRSPDPAAAQAFYGQVFGFTYSPVDMAPSDYQTFAAADGAARGGIGGFMNDAAAGPHWLVYFGVSDAEAAVAAVSQNGGTAPGEVFPTPFGAMVTIADPFGARLQLVQVPAS